MYKKIVFWALLFCFCTSSVGAHTLTCRCMDNMDGTVTCEASFSDGSSAESSVFKVIAGGKSAASGKVDEFGEFTFETPDGKYKIVVEAGPGHETKIPSGWVR